VRFLCVGGGAFCAAIMVGWPCSGLEKMSPNLMWTILRRLIAGIGALSLALSGEAVSSWLQKALSFISVITWLPLVHCVISSECFWLSFGYYRLLQLGAFACLGRISFFLN